MSAIEEFSQMIAYVEEMIQPPFITCRVLSGEEFEVEILPEMSYFALYQAITDKLPQDIRPRFIEQMNLLLEGELVPWHRDQQVVPSSEVYHIVLDTVSYQVDFTPVETHVRQGTGYQCWECSVSRHDQCWDEKSNKPAVTGWAFYFLYHAPTQSYLFLEDVRHEWDCSGWKWDREDRIDVWIQPDAPYAVWIQPDAPQKTQEEMLEKLMEKIEQTITPSLAGITFLRHEVKSYFSHLVNAEE